MTLDYPALGRYAAEHWYWISITAFLLFAAIETVRPDRRERAGLARRWAGHLTIYVLDLALSSTALPVLVFALVADRYGADATRLFQPVQSWGGQLAVLIAGLLLIDLLVYWAHRIQHRIALLWRFHAVHHADTDMDVATAFLHHPVAYLLVAAFTGFPLLSLGLPAWVFSVYALFEVAGGAFQHVGSPVPERLDRAVRWLFVTPGMHQIHHSADPAHHGANFANVLSVWDRLFGTLLLLDARERDGLRFGIGQDAPGLWGSLTLPVHLSSEAGTAQPVEQA